MKSFRRKNWLILVAVNLLVISCLQVSTLPFAPSTPKPDPLVMITFRVQLPNPLPPGEKIIFSELDEVTGLAFNQIQHTMEAEDSLHFILILPVRQNSLLKYRYVRQGTYSVLEHTSDGRPVRYRMFHATAPALIQDVIGRWTDTQFNLSHGRITGRAVRVDDSQPISNLLVTASGLQTWTAQDGSFVLEGVPNGTHNLVAYAADGAYLTFQQGATVADGAATEAILQLQPAKFIQVTFILEAPAGTPPNSTVRLAGNLLQLGNTFSSLRGGLGSTAVRLPVMQHLPNNKYGLTLSLPAGSDLRYKYTLGDGIWNAEHTSDGQFYIRQLILPDKDIEVNDTVVTWSDNSILPVTFQVAVPPTSPTDEIVAIQFNPGFTWLEALPMWPSSPQNWEFTLFSPLRGLESIQYRYCRDVQCGSADDSATTGSLAEGRLLPLNGKILLVQDIVEKWIWLDGKIDTAVVPNIQIAPRGSGFIAGIALQEGYHPSWLQRLNQTVTDINSLNANWVIINPTWTFTRAAPAVQEAIPGIDLAGFDLQALATVMRSQGLQTALFPHSLYPKPTAVWWQEAPRDFSWWLSWFEGYRVFVKHHASLAVQTGASVLILGDPSIVPALPNGRLADGSPSNAPEDALERWKEIIQDARQIFNKPIWWAVRYPQDFEAPPAVLDEVDGVYVLWSAPIAKGPEATVSEMAQEAGALFDNQLLPLQQRLNKPIILAVAYPSATGGSTGCLPGLEAGCLDLGLLNPSKPDLPNIERNLVDQENAYNAIFLAINDRLWISGLVSEGYYPPLILQDKSASIHGKPARGVLWFWFAKLLGK